MLVLNRRVGQSIYVGDEVRVTVVVAHHDRIVIGVSAPATACVSLGDTAMLPAIHNRRDHDGDERLYVLALRSGERFGIDDVEVRVKFARSGMSKLRARPKQVRLAIRAPVRIAVHREEIYAQIQTAAGRRAPALPFADWLRRANVSAPRPRSAMPAWVSIGARAPANVEFVFG